MKRGLLTVSLCLAIAACGAGASVQRGIDQYQLGHFQAAADQFESIESMQSSMNPKGLVRYMVFRGLALYRLGERGQAEKWLARGREAYARGDDHWINANALAEMRAALEDLEGEAPHAPSPPAHTTARVSPPAAAASAGEALEPRDAGTDADTDGAAPSAFDASPAGSAADASLD